MTARSVFLSYAQQDQEAASRVYALLEADGIGCWLASRDAMTSTDKAAASIAAIRNSDLVLLIFSASANSSPYVLREIERAISYERPVLSVHLDDSIPNASLEYYLNLWQWLEARGGVEDRRDEIVAAVREQLSGVYEQAKAPAPPEIAAPELAEEPEIGAGEATARPRRPSRRTWVIALASAVLLVTVGLGLGLGLGLQHHNSSLAQRGTWTRLSPSGTPPAGRDSTSLAYDSVDDLVIAFGGKNSSFIFYGDTWAYDPAANEWKDLVPSGTVPSARAGHSMAYDPVTHRLILFGGFDANLFRNDTWAYDSATNEWKDLVPSGTVPSARGGHSMAYDPVTRRIILFGGRYAQVGGPEPIPEEMLLNDTWAYDPIANSWTELTPSGTLPPPVVTMAWPTTPRRA